MNRSRKHRRWLDANRQVSNELELDHKHRTQIALATNYYDVERIRQLEVEEAKLREMLGRADYHWYTRPSGPSPYSKTEQIHLGRRLFRIAQRIRTIKRGQPIEMRCCAQPHEIAPFGYDADARFAYMNNTLFDGRLPKTNILFETLHGTLGKIRAWTNGTYDIVLNNFYDWTIDELDGVILHEMIHIDIAVEVGRPWAHVDWVHARTEFLSRLVECQQRVKFIIPITEMTSIKSF